MLTPGKIGRPASAVSRLKKSGDNWKFITITTTGPGGANSSSLNVFSKIAFGDPVVQVSGGSEYWFSWRYNRRMKFNDIDGTMEFKLAKNGDATHWERIIRNNDIDRCSGTHAPLIGQGVAPLVHIPAAESDGRCRINSYRGVALGTTVCLDTGSHLMQILLNGEIENIDLNGMHLSYGTVIVDVTDL